MRSPRCLLAAAALAIVLCGCVTLGRTDSQVQSATARVTTAETGLREAGLAYEGSLAELGKLDRKGDVGVQVRRAFEVIDALRSLSTAYDTYFLSINDYNRAQFRLYRSLGCPAEILSCERAAEPILPVDTTRPPQMAPVCAPDPCGRSDKPCAAGSDHR